MRCSAWCSAAARVLPSVHDGPILSLYPVEFNSTTLLGVYYWFSVTSR